MPDATTPPERPTPPERLTRADGSPVRALVVDDEPSLADLLRMALGTEGWEASVASNGQEALTLARELEPDVIVLDWMMPGLDGMEVVRRLRAMDDDVPVLFLTARDGVDDRIAGITAGGDDYVTKPFDLREVVARLRGMARRRVGEGARETLLQVGDLTLDDDAHEVRRAGEPIRLTAKEYELLRFLMRHPRRVLTRAEILQAVWSYDFGGRSGVVEIYVSYLRRKIDAHGPPLIHTVRSVGYAIRPA